jgi:hypothetical protein
VKSLAFLQLVDINHTNAMMTATRTWTCLCGKFQGQVTGEPEMAVFCHCGQCRRYGSTAMKLALFPPKQFALLSDEAAPMIRYESSPGITRVSCGTCGAFAFKDLHGKMVVPLGALE